MSSAASSRSTRLNRAEKHKVEFFWRKETISLLALLYQSLYKDVYGMPKEKINECIQRVRKDMGTGSALCFKVFPPILSVVNVHRISLYNCLGNLFS